MFRFLFNNKRSVLFLPVLLLIGSSLFAQLDTLRNAPDSTEYALRLMKEQRKKWGPNDTVLVPAILYQNEIVNYKEEQMVWVSKLSPDKLAKFIEEWTRLRNAVYVTYPYARIAAAPLMILIKTWLE